MPQSAKFFSGGSFFALAAGDLLARKASGESATDRGAIGLWEIIERGIAKGDGKLRRQIAFAPATDYHQQLAAFDPRGNFLAGQTMNFRPLCVAALLAAFVASSFSPLFAAQPQELLLWPEGAPGALGDEPKDKPKLIAYLPDADKATGAAIVVCPGGGYGGLAMDHEGHQIGAWLNSIGVAAFICDYRHRGKGYGHPAPLADAQRAIRTVRAKAGDWNVKPDRIGVLGFSAGGHLASTTVTHFDAGKADATDPIEKASCRPDFGVLCYAVIAFDQPYTHRGSQNNLLGASADKELVKSLSNEKQVTAATPPMFLWHTTEDTAVPPQNSAVFYLACVEHKVPAELHIFEKGRHGVGLGKGIVGTEEWSKLCEAWMRGRKLLEK